MNESIRLTIKFLPFLLVLSLVNVAHADDPNKKINVVTTVAPITNIVQNVGGLMSM